MCDFFSFVTAGNGKAMFFDAKMRSELKKSNPKEYKTDSHASIAAYHKLDEDKLNKYEYNPFMGVFKIDQINNPIDDRVSAEKWVRAYDFTEILETGMFNIDMRSVTILPEGFQMPEECGYIDMQKSIKDRLNIN